MPSTPDCRARPLFKYAPTAIGFAPITSSVWRFPAACSQRALQALTDSAALARPMQSQPRSPGAYQDGCRRRDGASIPHLLIDLRTFPSALRLAREPSSSQCRRLHRHQTPPSSPTLRNDRIFSLHWLHRPKALIGSRHKRD